MRRLLVVVALALAAAGPAHAKGLVSVQLCGASGCATAALPDGEGPLAMDAPVVAAARPAPYYRVRLVGDRSSIALWYVPGEAKLTLLPFGYDTFAWTTVAGSWRETLDALARRIDPYPVSTIARATVDGRAVADPQSYLVLWSLTGKPHGYPRDYGVQIVLRSTQPSPWTDGNFLQFLPRDRMLVRDGELVAVPRWIAARIGRRASLAGIR